MIMLRIVVKLIQLILFFHFKSQKKSRCSKMLLCKISFVDLLWPSVSSFCSFVLVTVKYSLLPFRTVHRLIGKFSTSLLFNRLNCSFSIGSHKVCSLMKIIYRIKIEIIKKYPNKTTNKQKIKLNSSVPPLTTIAACNYIIKINSS